MTPEQRIMKVLHSRGIEATEAQVSEWIKKMGEKFNERRKFEVKPASFRLGVADAIENGQKTWTMCLHLYFGDALCD